jgi:GNAT superfamily N-acetyltransferase
LQWHKQNHFVDLHYIGIKGPHRGKGLAVALLKILADTLKHEGAKRVCAQATWKGALQMMIKAWGKPVYLADDINEYTLDKAMELLADRSPEKYGRIESGYYLHVCYDVPKLPALDFDVNWEQR